ncbi:hypothetical protein NBRC111893_2096 [Lentilactobacillus kosonis]|uniref:Uncharacterized protein n=1 Tax=Lentilactobacillus kosonis TaxID=2810561 RepID=A0A401FNJ1_9LACO|nr:hypothetical protein NBRC111893_2096 [Lentilactobacillus kosonis]
MDNSVSTNERHNLITYFKWLVNQVKGWPQQNYYVFLVFNGASNYDVSL